MMQSNDGSSTEATKTNYDVAYKPYAQSLRVIGQALKTLGINAFALTKDADKFIVRDWEPSFLNNIADKIWGRESGQTGFTNANSRDLLVYGRSDAERLEAIARTRRASQNIEESRISSGLRVVGEYLDEQRAVEFNIWWSTESVIVKYKTAAGAPKKTNFTVQSLQDLAVGMYLRRSSRPDVK